MDCNGIKAFWGLKIKVPEWSALVVLEVGLWRFSWGLVVGVYIPINLVGSLMMKFLIHGREEWNPNNVELRVEFE